MKIHYESGEIFETNSDLGVRQLSGLDLHRAVLDHNFFESYIFEDSYLRGSSFRFCNLRSAKLISVKMMTADFSHSDLTLIDASQSLAMFTNFDYCDLSAAVFSGSDLRGASFKYSNLNGCDFRDTNLSGADFQGAKVDQTTRWTEGKLPSNVKNLHYFDKS